MNELRPVSEIVNEALRSLAEKWQWRAQHHMASGNHKEAARLLDDADALLEHAEGRA